MNQTQKLIVGITGGLAVFFIVGVLTGFEEIESILAGIILTGVFEYFFWKSPKEQEND